MQPEKMALKPSPNSSIHPNRCRCRKLTNRSEMRQPGRPQSNPPSDNQGPHHRWQHPSPSRLQSRQNCCRCLRFRRPTLMIDLMSQEHPLLRTSQPPGAPAQGDLSQKTPARARATRGRRGASAPPATTLVREAIEAAFWQGLLQAHRARRPRARPDKQSQRRT